MKHYTYFQYNYIPNQMITYVLIIIFLYRLLKQEKSFQFKDFWLPIIT